jgi:hypothetical protein
VGTAAAASAARSGSASRSGAHRLSSQNRGNEQISALLEKGVTVPIEQHHVRPRQLHAAVGRAGEAEIARVAQQHQLRMGEPLELPKIGGDGRVR